MKIERAHKILWPVLLGIEEPTRMHRRIIEDVMQKLSTRKARMRLSESNYQCYLDIQTFKQEMSVPKKFRERRAELKNLVWFEDLTWLAI